MNTTRPYSPVSLAALIVANSIPLVGVIWFAWSTPAVLAIYWLESAVVGAFTLLRMASCRYSPPAGTDARQPNRLATMAFFCVHFGMFMLIHGVFLAVMTGVVDGIAGSIFEPVRRLAAVALEGTGAWLALGGLGISHAASFVTNFLGTREFETVSLSRLVRAPYPRLLVMHLVILVGGILTTRAGQPIGLIVALVVIKTTIDARAHLREHRRFQDAAA